MPNPLSFTKQVSLLLEQHGSLSQAAISAATGRTLRQVSNALDGLVRHRAARYDPGTRQYQHIYRFDRYPTSRDRPIADAEKDAVYALCTGVQKQAIVDETGFTRAVVGRCLVRLAEQGKVQYTPDGWQQVECVPMAKSPPITPEDLAWQKYWSAENRQQRRADRFQCPIS
jgi:hypothetical protein